MTVNNGTWRPEDQRMEVLEEGGTWIVYLDTGILIADLDPDSQAFRHEARRRFIDMLEDDEFDLHAELDD